MPTLTVTHEAPLELIRQCPDVAVDLVRAMTVLELKAMMKSDEWKDDFIESYVKIGIEEGAAEKGAADVLKVLDARGLKPTEQQRAMVTADAGLAKLDLWFSRALTVATADEVFKEDEDER